MSDELTPQQQKDIDELSGAVARELAAGKSKATIVKELVKQEWPEDSAMQFVTQVEQALNQYRDSDAGRQAVASQYAKHMLYGALWAVGGTVVTVATYGAASSGGKYFVAWGAILFGIFDFLRGLFGWLKYRS